MKDKEYDILLREYEKLNRERTDMYILSFDEHIAYLKRAFLRAAFSKHLELDFYNRIMKCRPVQMHLIKNGRSRCIDTEEHKNTT